MRVPHSPGAGETVAGGVLSSDHGGKASNQAVAIRRLGTPSSLVSAVGDDAAGLAGRELWAAEGVDDHVVAIAGASTMTGFIVVEPSGENRICIAGGALDAFTPIHLEGEFDGLGPGDVVLVSLEIPVETAAHALRAAHDRGARAILNPAPVTPGARPLLADADVITPNRGELGILAGTAEPADAQEVAACCRLLRESTGYAGLVVVTLGAEGVLVDDGDAVHLVPPIPVANVVDTTGAGDAFSAAFAVALHEGRPIEAAARFATAAGALAVTREQVIPALPYRADVERLITTGAHGR